MGELLVLEYEKKRLVELGQIEAADNIRWVAKESDSYGYDIESFEIIDGTLQKIYIEVKTTKSLVDVDFFVSQNELEKSIALRSSYYIYRIYDANSTTPQMYISKGQITDNFILDPITYKARYKYPLPIA